MSLYLAGSMRTIRPWLLILLLTLTVPLMAGASEPLLLVATEMLLQHQATDGALTQGPVTARRARVVPYFANLGALGLVAAGRATGDARGPAAARRWVLWYEAHQNPDGAIFDYVRTNDQWQVTGACDATDAYAATFLELCAALQRAAPDAAWLRQRRPVLERAVAALRLTLQTNGLTCARPGWPVMYTMDNIEVLRGLRAGEELAGALGDAAWQRELATMAERTGQALGRELFDAARQVYRVGVQTNGASLKDKGEWYPLVMANLMAVAELPSAPRQHGLFEKLQREQAALIPSELRTPEAWDRLLWWGYAARGAGDVRLHAAIVQRLRTAAALLPTDSHPATLGRLCLVLAPD